MFVAGKITALWFVIVALLAVVMVTAMLVQAFNGYFEFQPGVYIRGQSGVDQTSMIVQPFPPTLTEDQVADLFGTNLGGAGLVERDPFEGGRLWQTSVQGFTVDILCDDDQVTLTGCFNQGEDCLRTLYAALVRDRMTGFANLYFF